MKTLNNNIEETRVSFVNAKLLKKVGFDIKCTSYYRELNPLGTKEDYSLIREDNKISENWNFISYASKVSAPTHQLAIDWIRLNFNIHIEIYNYDNFYKWRLSKFKFINLTKFNTPEEAKEAAIKYVLENLIKDK